LQSYKRSSNRFIYFAYDGEFTDGAIDYLLMRSKYSEFFGFLSSEFCEYSSLISRLGASFAILLLARLQIRDRKAKSQLLFLQVNRLLLSPNSSLLQN